MINGRKTDRISHEDIRHKDRLTEDQITKIPLSLVYEWVSTGKWKFKEFRKFMNTIGVKDD